MPSTGQSTYRNAIRAAVRGLWSEVMDYYQAWELMDTAIRQGLAAAFHEGLGEVGVLPSEMNPQERIALERAVVEELGYVDGLLTAVEAGSKANGGKLGPLMMRAEMWANRYRDVVNRARVMAGEDKKLKWTLGPTEHCVSAGTNVLTPNGWKPIQFIRKGDQVETLQGPRRVQKTEENPYYGPLVRVHGISCTVGHRFLTVDGGWVRADHLTDSIQTHLAFPDAGDGISTGRQVSLLGAVSFLLRLLPFGKRFKPGMSVPIVAVRLDDERRSDQSIHNELGLDQEKSFVLETKRVQVFKERKLQLGWLALLNAAVALHKMLNTLRLTTWVLLVKLAYLGNSLWIPHRVVLTHILGSSGVNDSESRCLRKCETKDAGSVQDLLVGQGEHLRNPNSAFGRVVLSQDTISLRCPDTRPLGRRGVDTAKNDLPIANMSTHRARLRLGRLQSGIVHIPALDRAKSRKAIFPDITRIRNTFKRLPAHLARKAPRWVRVFLAASHLLPPDISTTLDRLYHINFLVYNLEVEGEHHYIVDGGLVVHNCIDCARLSDKVKRASQWEAANIRPQMQELECHGFNCQCTLVPTDEPMSKGPLPKLRGG